MNQPLIDNPDLQTQCLIQVTNIEVWSEYLHDCIDELTNKKPVSFNKFKSLTNWTQEQFDTIKFIVKNFLTCIVLLNYDQEKILKWCSEIDQEHQNIFLNNFLLRKKEIEKFLITKNCAISGDIMNDFDWKLKWVYGSSKLSTFKDPLLELNLNLNEENISKEFGRKKTKDLSIEMNKDELNLLIRNLEKSVSYLTN